MLNSDRRHYLPNS